MTGRQRKRHTLRKHRADLSAGTWTHYLCGQFDMQHLHKRKGHMKIVYRWTKRVRFAWRTPL
jgi:hypothetical protein